MDQVIEQLIARSRHLGSDQRNTNYGGGNTSAKTTLSDPTGSDIEVLLIKGSGGDLGTLTETGLSHLDVGKIRGLKRAYRGVEHEDEMVGLLDYCRVGAGGAAPSIDTAMHALLPMAHVDHLHPDSIIAFATAADGKALTAECFGGAVGWIDWRRPGFELALEVEAAQAADPELRGVILGGHGLTTWSTTSDDCERTSLELINTATQFIKDRGRAEPFGAARPGFDALPAATRRTRAAALAPTIRGLASTDSRMLGHFTDASVVLEFLSRASAPALVELGTSCPDHFLRTKIKPLLVDVPTSADDAEIVARLRELHETYREYYRGYYDRHATPDSPAIRGADPAIVLVPGVGMFSFGADKQTARVASEYYLNAINVMRGAEALSTYAPISEAEKFRIEYWELEEAKLRRRPAPKPLSGRVALVTGAASGIGRATAETLAVNGACVVVTDVDGESAERAAKEIGDADAAVGQTLDVTSETDVAAGFEAAVLAFGGVDIVVNNAGTSISKSLSDTTVADWDMLHDVLARGSFVVSRAAAQIMAEQGLGGDIVYVVSKNGVLAGPANLAYSAAKADQAHQVRLLAAELGEIGVRVNGVNPDGVVAGSGIFANGWGQQRAAFYGVEVDNLGEFYAQRTLLKREVLPEHVADAIFALVSGLFSRTTGLHVPVDGGIPGAFMR
jgi:rhamnulose-1-phosphate aldolase/alcohol dehydrogenase